MCVPLNRRNLVGHHLRALRAAQLATSRREHKIVFYALWISPGSVDMGLLGGLGRCC
jgi:DNA-binding transcriptional ArsR family regulator